MPRIPIVLLLIPHLGGGGAEQVTALLARNLAREKYDLHLGLFTLSSAGPTPLPPHVTVHALGVRRARWGAGKLLRLVWRLRPDLILCGMAHLNFMVLFLRPLFPPPTRVLVRQNGTASSLPAIRHSPAWTRLFYRLLYRRADGVICQSPAMAEDLRRESRLPLPKLVLLPNPIDIEAIHATIKSQPSRWCGPGPHLLAVGRLSAEKGFDLLLQAMACLKHRFPTADMSLAGQGPEESALRALCRSLNLDASVRFLGQVEDPATWFPGASLFVVSSRCEGLPNALLESAAAGLPLVALPASGGIVDLLKDQPGCFLARELSANALAESLTVALASLCPGERFPHEWIEPFRVQNAVPAYETLIDATLRKERL